MKDFSFTILKELLEVLVKFIEAVAWPGVVAFVATNYRSEFRSILNRLEKAKLGEAELLLSKEQAEETVAKASEQAINILFSGNAENSITSNKSSTNQETDKPVAVRTGDVDGDGRDELIVSSLEGPYWSRVKVFKPILEMSRNNKLETSFKLIGEICPVNFLEDVRDIDSDKYAEIIVNEDEQGSNQPHAAGFREKVIYKFISGQIKEISREKIPRLNTQGEMNEFAAQEFKDSDCKMNEVFDKIISKLETRIEFKLAMENAQEAWLKYREFQAKAISNTYKGGSIQPLVYYSNMTKFTNIRINELEKISHARDGDGFIA
jgi:uncharacterized protein YecT (DUF1311 family)